MDFDYTAYNQQGKVISGTIDSQNTIAAMELLRRKGLFVSRIARAGRRVLGRGPGKHIHWPGQTQKTVAVFTRQLCVLIASGTPVLESLSALERQSCPGPWRACLKGMQVSLEAGDSLSEAMKAYPKYFDTVYQCLIRAGESSGRLVDVLDRLGQFKQKQVRVQNQIVGAMIYPILLLSVAVCLFPLMLVFIIPRFSQLFASLDVPLPGSTKCLVDLSVFLKAYGWMILLLFLGVQALLILFLGTERGQETKDRVLLRLPLLGGLVKGFVTTRIVRLLGVLLGAKIPLLEALQLIHRATGNSVYDRCIASSIEQVTEGESLSKAFEDSQRFNPSIVEAIRSGEQTGRLDHLMNHMADFLEDENEVVVRSLTSVVEPMILVTMGLLVGGMAISMFMPLFDLTAMTGGR